MTVITDSPDLGPDNRQTEPHAEYQLDIAAQNDRSEKNTEARRRIFSDFMNEMFVKERPARQNKQS
jgi:hypothetical protein